MSNFTKKLAKIREAKLNKKAEGEGKIPSSPELQNYVANGWINQYGKVTPYHIIMMEDVETMYGMNATQAKEMVEMKYNQLNTSFRDMEDYTNLSADAENKFLSAIRNCRTVAKIADVITNFSMKSEDLGVNKGAEIEEEELEKMARSISDKLVAEIKLQIKASWDSLK